MPSPTPTPFETSLFNFLSPISQESNVNYIYLDTEGVPTLGAGSALIVRGLNGVYSPVYNLDAILDAFIDNQVTSGTAVGNQVLRQEIRDEIDRIINGLNGQGTPNGQPLSVADLQMSTTFAPESDDPAGLGGELTPQGVLDVFILRYRDPIGNNGGQFGFEGVDGDIARAFDSHKVINSAVSFRTWDRLKADHPSRALAIAAYAYIGPFGRLGDGSLGPQDIIAAIVANDWVEVYRLMVFEGAASILGGTNGFARIVEQGTKILFEGTNSVLDVKTAVGVATLIINNESALLGDLTTPDALDTSRNLGLLNKTIDAINVNFAQRGFFLTRFNDSYSQISGDTGVNATVLSQINGNNVQNASLIYLPANNNAVLRVNPGTLVSSLPTPSAGNSLLLVKDGSGDTIAFEVKSAAPGTILIDGKLDLDGFEGQVDRSSGAEIRDGANGEIIVQVSPNEAVTIDPNGVVKHTVNGQTSTSDRFRVDGTGRVTTAIRHQNSPTQFADGGNGASSPPTPLDIAGLPELASRFDQGENLVVETYRDDDGNIVREVYSEEDPSRSVFGRTIEDRNSGAFIFKQVRVFAGDALITYTQDAAAAGQTSIDNVPRELNIEFPNAFLTGEQIGSVFGSTLGRQLAGDNQIAQLAAGVGFGTLGSNLGELADNFLRDLGGEALTNSEKFVEAFGNFFDDLAVNAVGSVSSLLTAELVNALGIDGFVGGVANAAGSATIGGIAHNLIFVDDVSNLSDAINNLSGAQIGSAVGSFLGSQLASSVVTPRGQAEQLGFSIGSSLGSTGLVSLLGQGAFLQTAFQGLVLGGIGAFVGAVLGRFAVDAFSNYAPRSGVHVYFDEESGTFQVLADGQTVPGTNHQNWREDDGSREAARILAGTAADVFNNVLNVLTAGGSELLSTEFINGSAWGQFNTEDEVEDNAPLKFTFWHDGENSENNPSIQNNFETTTTISEAVGQGVGYNLNEMTFVGGDLYVRRAFYNSIETYSLSDSSSYDPLTILGDLSVGADYSAFIQNDEIPGIIGGAADTNFSSSWLITIARAIELNLNDYHQSDFFGGLQSFAPFFSPDQSNFADVQVSLIDDASVDGDGNELDPDTAVDDLLISFGADSVIINDFAETMGFDVDGPTTSLSDLRIASDDTAVNFTDSNETNALNSQGPLTDNGKSRLSDDIFIGRGGDDTLSGGRGWDWLDGGTGNDKIDGGVGKDVLLGREGDDRLDGGDGDDTLADGSGADNIQGGEGDDKILVAQDSDADRFDGDGGSDTVSYADWTNGVTLNVGSAVGQYGDTYVEIENVEGSHFADDITGDSSANLLSGLSGDDTLDGYVGNDTIDGGAGADVLEGGAGINTASYQSASSGVAVSLETGGTGGDAAGDTFNNIQNLQGSEHGDHLQGDDKANSIAGGAGNDYLIGSGGGDAYDGGDGFDIVDYSSSNTGVVVNLQVGSSQGDPDAPTSGSGDPEPGGGGAVTPEVIYRNILSGTSGADNISGDRFNNQIWAGDGNDTVNGGGGQDMIGGGAGNDRILTGAADDVAFGGGGDDRIFGGSGNDELYGGAGSDELRGESGDDTLYGGAGNDTLYGATGRDVIYGGDGEDVVFAHEDNDTVHGGAGDDTLNGGEGRDFLTGGAGNDAIFGGGQADVIYGDEGDDFLGGTAHDDTLYDGTGRDTVVGNTGDDVLKISDDGEADRFRGGTATLDNGNDTASFDDWHRSVSINLSQTVNGFTIFNGNDSLQGIENLILTGHADDATGDNEDNVIRGLGGEDTLRGHDGDDTIYGDEESDVIDGGAGDDLLHGGLAYGDKFEFVGAWGDDTIADFELGRDTLSFVGDFTESDLIYEEVREDRDGDGTLETVHTRVRIDGQNASVLVRNVTVQQLRDNPVNVNEEETPTTQSAADEFITGDEKDNVIWAQEGDDTVFAGAGDDTIGGGEGNDVLHGGDGSDVIFSAAGDDFADGGTGPDQVFGGDDEDTLLGGSGDDTVFGSAGNDVIHDGVGSDVLVGRGGNDKFVLANDGTRDKVHGENQGKELGPGEEPGRDLVSYEEWDRAVSVDLEIAHDPEKGQLGDIFFGIDDLLLTAQSDFGGGDAKGNQLIGGAGDDTLHGRAGDDTLEGGSGDDVLMGGIGDDLLIGGSGQSDTYVFEAGWGNDTIRGFNAEIDVIDINATGLKPEDLILTRVNGGTRLTDGDGNSILLDRVVVAREDINFGFTIGEDRHTNVEGVIGSDHNDILIASNSGSWLAGGRGNDELVGGQSDDSFVINVGDGVDTFEAKGGFDSIIIGEGAGFANLRLENDQEGAVHTTTLTIDAAGSTSLVSRSGIYGGSVEQIVLSNGYAVNISGTRYQDGETVLRGLDAIVNGDGGANRVGSPVPEQNASGTVPEHVFDRRWLSGWAGNDSLYGGRLNDVLHGGTGNDRLEGDMGNDTYLYAIGDGHDVVIDAEGQGDTLVFDEGIRREHLSYEWVGSGNNRALRVNVNPDTGPAGSVTINTWIQANGAGRIEWIYVDGTRLNLPREVHLDGTLENAAPINTTDLIDLTVNSNVIGAQSVGSVAGFDADGDPLRYHVNGNSEFWFQGNKLYTRIDDTTQQVNVLSITISDGRDSIQSQVSVVLTSATQPEGTINDIVKPVVFDLDGDGVELISFYDSNVLFDMDNDGIRERSGWVGADDGLLVLDRNRNGLIDDASEISFVDDFAGANTDIEGLQAFDTNEDGKLTANDDGYSNFQIWRDVNSDGISQASELFKLEDLGITEISLDIQAANQLLEGRIDNAVTGTVSYTTASGSTGEAADVSFVHDGGNGLVVRPIVENLGAEFVGGSGPDTLLGGLGHDTLHGGGGADRLLGGQGNDQLEGDIADDTLEGNIGDDTLRGNDGADVLSGGSGTDKLSGGSGGDVFSFVKGWGTDTITDFVVGEDTIDVGPAGLRFEDITIVQVGDNTEVSDGEGNVIILENVTASSINQSDFEFEEVEYIPEGERVIILDTTVSTSSDLTVNEDGLSYTFDQIGNNPSVRGGAPAQFSVFEGKWYWELTLGYSPNSNAGFGLIAPVDSDWTAANTELARQLDAYFYDQDGRVSRGNGNGRGYLNYNNPTGRFGNGDVVGVAFDVDSGKIWLSINGVWAYGASDADVAAGLNPTFDGVATGAYVPFAGLLNSNRYAGTFNFGSSDFADAVPVGFEAYNEADPEFTPAQFVGTSRSDDIVGTDGAEVISGNDGDDTLEGGAGSDTLEGGTGVDTASYAGSAEAVHVDLATGTTTGGDAEDDTLRNIEVVLGSDHGDTLVGSSGNETLDGGSGEDHLLGNGGNDYLQGGIGSDIVEGGDGDDTLEGHIGADRLIGGAGHDVLNSGSGDDTVEGGAGNDTLLGHGGGADVFDGGADHDRVSYAQSSSGVVIDLNLGTTGGAAAGHTYVDIEEIVGSGHADTLAGGASAEALTGGGGNDRLVASAGADTLDGGDGIDRLDYTHSDGAVSVNLSTGISSGGYAEGDVVGNVEQLFGSAFSDLIVGDSGNTTLSGGAGADSIVGEAGNDLIYGNAGNDELVGGAGNDTLEGGGDNDKFVFATGWGVDTITDFTQGVDIIDFSGTTLQFEDLTITQVGADTEVADGNGNTVTLQNVTAVNLTENDFTFINLIRGTEGDDNLNGTNAPERIEGLGGDDNLYGKGDDDSLEGGSGDDRLYGEDGDDSLNGGEDRDTLEGGRGSDTLDGGSGSDTADYHNSASGISINLLTNTHTGDAAGDVFIDIESFVATNHSDSITGDAGDNNFAGLAGNDSLEGGTGNDRLFGEDGNDVLRGGGDDDRLEGGRGADTIDGGAGHDVVEYRNSGSGVSVNLTTNVHAGDAAGDVFMNVEAFVATHHNDTLIGDTGADNFAGLAGDDSLASGAGNDRLYGEDGDDSLDGGAGNDRLVGGAGSDVFVFGANWGVDTVTDFTKGEDTLNLTATGLQFADLTITQVGADTQISYGTDSITLVNFTVTNLVESDFVFAAVVEGTGNNDTLQAVTADTTINALGGDDLVYAGPGVDRIDGGDGYDRVSYASSVQAISINLTSGINTGDATGDIFINVETFEGSNCNDTLIGGSSNDHFVGLEGNDLVRGEGGNDYIWTQGGDDTVFGGVDSDTIGGMDGADVLHGEDGNDYLNGGNGDDTLYGGAGDDTVRAYYGANQLFGGDGSDSLQGGGDSETLDGGVGNDTLSGQGGNDSFVFGANWGSDVVTDFVKGSDTIDLSDTGLQFSDLTITQAGADTQIVDGNGNTITLQNFTATTLTESDFAFAGVTVGTEDVDYIQAVIGGGVIQALGGNDQVTAGSGVDHIDGGEGFDIVHYVSANKGVSINLATGVNTGDAAGDTYVNVERLNGSNHGDTIVGGAGIRILTGLGGNDSIVGTDDNETLNGGADNDVVDGGGGADSIYDDTGSDTLRGGTGNDRLYDGGDSAPLADVFDGGEGTDIVDYGNGSAGLSVNLSTGVTAGVAAGDTYIDLEQFYGTNHNDAIVGGGGFTLLHGRDGDDSLAGVGSNETLTGGAGNDSFIFGVNWGADTVTDFTKGEDALDLSATGLQFADLTITQVGSDTLIEGGNGNQITLTGVTASSIDETDFTFSDVPVQSVIGPRSVTLDESVSSTNHFTWDDNSLTYQYTSSGGAYGGRPTQVGVSSGKWYWEQTLDHATSAGTRLGLIAPDTTLWNASSGYHVVRQQDVFSYQGNGRVYHGDMVIVASSSERSFGRDDVIGVAFDADAGKLWISINGEWLNGATEADIENGLNATVSDIPEGVYAPFATGSGSNQTVTFNFGATDFASSPPSGFSEYSHADPEFGLEITGSVSDNLLEGTDFDDVISGGDGDDTIHAQTGPDTIDGGDGDDLIASGTGADIIRFTAHWGADTVTDFEVGTDTLDMTGTDLRFNELTIAQIGADTQITDIFGNSITLSGVTASNITEADFTFRDTAPPTVTIDKLVTTDTTPTITGTIDNPFATVEVTIGGSTYTAINSGDGTWTAQVTSILPDGEYSPFVRAIDRHGVESVVEPGLSFQTTALTGAESAVSGIDIGNNSAPALVDIDNDGDLDMVVGTRFGSLRLFENTGDAFSPVFTEQTAGANPFDGIDAGDYAQIAFVDIDNDGDQDAFVGTGLYLENTGTAEAPVFVERTGADNPLDGQPAGRIAFVDIDADGDMDAVTTRGYNGSNRVTLVENTGSADAPNFVETAFATLGTDPRATPFLFDVNEDGHIDLLMGLHSGAIGYYQAYPNQNFSFNFWSGGNPFQGVATHQDSVVALGDLDADGDLDAIVGYQGGGLAQFRNITSDNTPDVHIDLTAPTIDITTPAHWFQRDVPRSVGGTVDDPNAEIEVNLVGQTFVATNHGNGNWDVNLPVAVGAGTITINVSATDSVGNVGNGTLEFDIEPIVTIDAMTTADTTPMITGTIDAPATEISIVVNGVTVEGVNNSDGTWFAELPEAGPALADGDYAITYDLTLASGATYQGGDVAANGEHSLTIDTAGTAIALDASQSDYPTVTGTVGDAETTVEVMIGGETVAATNNGDGTWSADLSGMLVSGSHVLTVNATDPQGNMSTVNQSYDIAPLVSFNGVTTRDNTPTLTGTVDDPTATVTVEVDGISYAAVNNGDGTWEVDVTAPIADGYHAAIVTATDSNGLATEQIFTSEHISFTQVTGEDNPFDGINANFYKSVTFMDIDSDGDLDAVAVTSVTESSAEQIKYFENTGNANAAEFVEQTGSSNPFDLLSSENLAGNAKIVLSDVDGDGDLDMVLSTARELYYYQNTGDASAPNFVKQTGAADPFDGISTNRYYQGVYFADIDGDGDEDFVTSWGSGGVQFYENTSSGGNIAFTHRTDPADNPFSNLSADHFTIVDVDLDGDLDFVNSNLSYYENIGSKTDAQFVSRAGADNPFDGSPTQSNGARYHALVDLDNDGDLDTFLASYSQTSSPIQRNGYLNESTPVAIHIDSTAPVVEFDAIDKLGESFPTVTGTINDGEASVEVVVGGQTFTGVNNGDGTWSAEISGIVVSGAHDIEVRATDTFGNIGTNSITSDFAPVVTLKTISTQDTTPTLTGTVDDPNATIEVTVGGNTYTGINHGDGTWEAAVTDTLSEGDYSVSVRATDTAGRVGYNDRELLGYSEVNGVDNPLNGVDTDSFSSPEFADLDGDGDLDLILSNWSNAALYYENTGSSQAPVYVEQTGVNNPFSAFSFQGRIQYNTTLVDIDADGDLDAFIGYDGWGVEFLRNDGTSTSPQFTHVTGTDHPFDGAPNVNNSAAAFADIDNDGDLDAIWGQRNGIYYYFRNEGTATNPDFVFVSTGEGNPFYWPTTGYLGGHSKPIFFDYDGDGDQDVIAGQQHNQGLRVFENQGTVDNPDYLLLGSNPALIPSDWNISNTDPAFIDLDGDNVSDFVVGYNSGGLRFYRADTVELTIEPGSATASAKAAFAPPPTSAATAAVALEEGAPAEVTIMNGPAGLSTETDLDSISEDQLREAWLHLREENAGAEPSREQLASMLAGLTGRQAEVAAKQEQDGVPVGTTDAEADLPVDTPGLDVPEFESGMDESFLMPGIRASDVDDATVQVLTQAAEQAQADMAGLLGSAEMLQSPTFEAASQLAGLDVDAGQFDLVAANDQSLLALTQAMATFDNGSAAMETDTRRRMEREETIGSLFTAGGSL